VGETEGSGIVHIAPGCGAEDYELGAELGLPAIAPLDGRGIYVAGFDWLTGRDVHEVEKPIFADLERKGLLLRHESYRHRYPFCWRCHEKLVFRMEDEWFLRSQPIRPLMKAAAEKVRWIPESVGKRTQDWYDNMGDWCISRSASGACRCLSTSVRGAPDLGAQQGPTARMAVDPARVDALPSCTAPGSTRSPSVARTRTAAGRRGASPTWAIAGWMRASCPTRRWATLKTAPTGKPGSRGSRLRDARTGAPLVLRDDVHVGNAGGPAAYKAVFSYEKLLDEQGEAMHRSKGNAIWFDEAVERMGADVMRWYYCAFNPNQNLRFGFTTADDLRRRLITLWNVYAFLVTYAELDGFDPARDAEPAAIGQSANALDRWIISSLYQLVRDMRRCSRTTMSPGPCAPRTVFWKRSRPGTCAARAGASGRPRATPTSAKRTRRSITWW